MKKVRAEDLIGLIKQRFPEFLSYWDSYVSYWGDDEGLTMQVNPFADYIIDVIKIKDEDKIKEIFDFIEYLLCNGDQSVQNAIATSLLEYLLSKDPEEIQFCSFSKYLGKETVEYCRAWDKLTGLKTKGL